MPPAQELLTTADGVSLYGTMRLVGRGATPTLPNETTVVTMLVLATRSPQWKTLHNPPGRRMVICRVVPRPAAP